MKGEQLSEALEGLITDSFDLASVEVEGGHVFPAYEFIIQQSIPDKGVAIQIDCRGVHGNEFRHNVMASLATLDYIGGPSLAKVKKMKLMAGA